MFLKYSLIPVAILLYSIYALYTPHMFAKSQSPQQKLKISNFFTSSKTAVNVMSATRNFIVKVRAIVSFF